jgi:hypothetical protein
MSHAFFLVMGGFVWEDERSVLHTITAEDLYGWCPNDERPFLLPKLIQTDGLHIPLYNSPSSGTQTTVINSTLSRTMPDNGPAVPQGGDKIPLPNFRFLYPPTNKSTIPSRVIDLIARISEADIVDKSAGDELSKFIAMIQVVWFVAQLIGRKSAEITITELEVVTAGYAVMNLAIYILWWSKPLRVNRQIVLYSCRVPSQGANSTPLYVPKTSRRWHRWVAALIMEAWYSIVGARNRNVGGIRDKVGLLWAGMSGDVTGGTLVFSILLASVFGSIHLAAWNFHFLSLLEMWLWRSNSLAITALPLLIMLCVALGIQLEDTCVGDVVWGYAAQVVMAFILPILYVICRIVLLVLPLIQLRSLPPSAFLVIPWSTFMPHI